MWLSEHLIKWIHALPRINYKFQVIKDLFNTDINGSYVQSLVVFCGISLFISLLLLFIIVFSWICKCCFKKSEQVHSRRHVKRLSTSLFVISIICFILLGACLYGNEHMNKSITSAGGSLSDFTHNIRVVVEQIYKLNQTQHDATQHIEEITVLIEQTSKEIPDINQTMLRETDSLLTDLSDKVDDVRNSLSSFSEIFTDLNQLDRNARLGLHLEHEKWLLCLTLLIIIICVLFTGVIAFCWQSRCGAVTFSALGIVIFLVTWTLFSGVFPITVAYADFCADGRPYLRSKFNEAILEVMDFYSTCVPNPATQDNTPPNVPLGSIDRTYSRIRENHQKLEGLLSALFNRSAEIENVSQEIFTDITRSFKSIGALETILSCYSMRRDVATMERDFCRHGFFGLAIITSSLLLLGLFLFGLLMTVSKTWHIFIRLPSDYMEVGEEDHFSPRGQDSIPDNVYDTNVFNPRARQFGGMIDESNNGSAVHDPTSEAACNGYANNNHSVRADSGANLTGTWLRGANGGASLMASVPPATNTIGYRDSNNYYRLSKNSQRGGGSGGGAVNNHVYQPAMDFHEQFDM